MADTLLMTPHYPTEDTKLRATAVKRCGGGPAATGVVAAAKLGVPASFIGHLSDDGDGRFLLEDFQRYGVDTAHIRMQAGCQSFCSFVCISAQNATRTCIAHPGTLPPLALTPADRQAIAAAQVLLVDGNELDAAVEAAAIARKNGVTVLYDAGSPYPQVERLLPLADVLIPSEEFALRFTGEPDVPRAAQALYARFSPRAVVVTQGKRGGLLCDGQTITPYPPYDAEVVDSNGAGDVFHGAFAAGLVRGYRLEECCRYASAAAALKCTGFGARESVPSHEAVLSFLKENRYA